MIYIANIKKIINKLKLKKMKTKNQIQSLGNGRYAITIIVNLVLIAKALALVAIAFVGYLLVKAVLWLAPIVWQGIISATDFITTNIWWFVSPVILILLVLLLIKYYEAIKNFIIKNSKLLLAIVAISMVALLAGMIVRSCDRDKVQQPQVVEQQTTSERIIENFDYVVTTRAYLDGVQATPRFGRSLVGLKFVDGKLAKNHQWSEETTYEEAILVIAQDWSSLIEEMTEGLSLSDEELIAITLFAMRNGKAGFENSKFLEELRLNGTKGASRHMSLHYKSGKERKLGDEAKQYLWIIKNIWDGNISYEDLLDAPSFSYKNIPVESMYDGEGMHLFSEEMYKSLFNGDYPTPREALLLGE